jgi:hypothetical protein
MGLVVGLPKAACIKVVSDICCSVAAEWKTAVGFPRVVCHMLVFKLDWYLLFYYNVCGLHRTAMTRSVSKMQCVGG